MTKQKTAKSQSRSGHILKEVLKTVVPLGVSALLIVWLMRKVDARQMWEAARHCDYGWIVLMMVLMTISRMIRGSRWGIQLRGAGLKPVPRVVEWISIFGAYALNLVLQSLGEVWRCVYMARREKAPVATVIGTDIGDRISDLACIMVLVTVTFFVARDKIMHFMDHYRVGETILHVLSDPYTYIWIVLGLVVLAGVAYVFRDSKFIVSALAQLKKVWVGFRIIFTMPGRGRYVLLTVAIWTCYFLETYVCFYAFPFTRELITQPGTWGGILPGLVVFTFGSISMGVPSSGGLGPWNLAVMFGLSLYGVSDTDGSAYSFVVWGSQAIAIIAAGIFSAVWIALRKDKTANDGANIVKKGG